MGDESTPIKTIRLESLAQRLPEVLADIGTMDSVWRVQTSKGESDFILGSPANCGRVLGLYDVEYGWPTPVDLDQPWTIEDLVPGPRRHPVLMLRKAERGFAISLSEYQEIIDQEQRLKGGRT